LIGAFVYYLIRNKKIWYVKRDKRYNKCKG
jgi:hypothetical protein